MVLVAALLRLLQLVLTNRATLIAENLALRQQLAALQRSSPRPRLCPGERVFWVMLSRWFRDWKCWLVIVQTDTVVRWHRHGFRLFWRWKSRGQPGRPTVSPHVQNLIRKLAIENPLWGIPRIQSELRLLGHDLGKRSANDRSPVAVRAACGRESAPPYVFGGAGVVSYEGELRRAALGCGPGVGQQLREAIRRMGGIAGEHIR